MRTRLLLLIAVLVVTAGLTHTALAATKTVSVGDYFFKSKSLTIASGDKVRFKWTGSDTHDVKFTKKPRKAKAPKRCGSRSSGTCSRKLKRRGTYRFMCTLHPEMRGKVTVD